MIFDFQRLQAIKSEIFDGAQHVPFGNSEFQIAAFTGGEHGRARRIRVLLLNMESKLHALEDAQFSLCEHQIDMDEAAHLLSRLDPADNSTKFERQRLELKKGRAVASYKRTEKAVADLSIEFRAMYDEWKSLPQLTSRAEFEAEERQYWLRRLTDDALREIKQTGSPGRGTLESLNQMGLDYVRQPTGDWALTGPADAIAALSTTHRRMELSHG